MEHIVKQINDGLLGNNKGLKTGLNILDKFTSNLQKKTYTVLGALQKTGKTKFLISRYIIGVWLNNPNSNIHWIWYSPEIDLAEATAMCCSIILKLKYNIIISTDKIFSRGDNNLSSEEYTKVLEIYNNDIKILFGDYTSSGKKVIKTGKIDFIEDRENPTGVFHYLMNYAKENGEFIYESYETTEDEIKVIKSRLVGYKEKDPSLYTIVLYDHVGLAKKERGYTKKDNIDKLSQYAVIIRNLCYFIFVFTSQFNRDLGKIERLKFSGEEIQPSADDFKDTGSLAEDCNILLALFDPCRHPHLRTHLGYDLKKLKKVYRSVHVLVARGQPCPVDLAIYFDGETGYFKELPKSTEMTDDVYNKINNKKY